MELFRLPPRYIDMFASSGVQITRAALVEEPLDGFAVSVMKLEPDGRVGRHPTHLWQLFLVLDGSGWVSGDDGQRHVVIPGHAALWAPGEQHESGTKEGMLAVVVECRARPLPSPLA
ncbi:MAG: hypothetical protein H0W56_10620 [Acidothermales bacterium]|nr:hypothetical protein [Acidothermales bacterium]